MRQLNIFRRKKQQHETTQQEAALLNLPSFEKLTEEYEAVIHIGIPGTGSAAIQKFLFDNHTRLAQSGFYYPVSGQNNIQIWHRQSKLGSYIEKNDLAAAKLVFDNYLAKAKKNNLTLLLSEKSLYAHPDRFNEVTSGKKCKIVAFFRDPLDGLFSTYNYAVKHDFVTTTLKEFCQNTLNSNNDRLTGKTFEQWQQLYSKQNLLVLEYDQSLFGLIKFEMVFLTALGIDKNLFNTFKYSEGKINPSLSFAALELRRLLNFVIDKELFYYNHNIDWLLQNYSGQSGKFPLHEYIPEELYLALQDKFKETNAYLLDEILTHLNINFIADNSQNKVTPVTQHKYHDSQLKIILERLLRNDATIKKYLINRTTKALPSKSNCYYVLRLADLLGIDIQPYIHSSSEIATHLKSAPLFTQGQINHVFLSKTAEPADFLREIAITLEQHGDYKSAQLVIERAFELRPHGSAIIALRDKLKNNHQKT